MIHCNFIATDINYVATIVHKMQIHKKNIH